MPSKEQQPQLLHKSQTVCNIMIKIHIQMMLDIKLWNSTMFIELCTEKKPGEYSKLHKTIRTWKMLRIKNKNTLSSTLQYT